MTLDELRHSGHGAYCGLIDGRLYPSWAAAEAVTRTRKAAEMAARVGRRCMGVSSTSGSGSIPLAAPVALDQGLGGKKEGPT